MCLGGISSGLRLGQGHWEAVTVRRGWGVLLFEGPGRTQWISVSPSPLSPSHLVAGWVGQDPTKARIAPPPPPPAPVSPSNPRVLVRVLAVMPSPLLLPALVLMRVL